MNIQIVAKIQTLKMTIVRGLRIISSNAQTTFLYYQATKKWLNLMAMAGAQGAEEASSAMDEMSNTGKEISKPDPTPVPVFPDKIFIILLSIKATIAQITVKKLIVK
jgi:hypothetical protein